jgi:capsular polysaccharide biosynthesis protein
MKKILFILVLTLVGCRKVEPVVITPVVTTNVFNNAKVIVSLYGAAMYMINFCKKKTKVIEIKPYKSGNDFLRISNLNDLVHYQIKLKPIIKTTNNQQGLLMCPVSTLKKYLKK